MYVDTSRFIFEQESNKCRARNRYFQEYLKSRWEGGMHWGINFLSSMWLHDQRIYRIWELSTRKFWKSTGTSSVVIYEFLILKSMAIISNHYQMFFTLGNQVTHTNRWRGFYFMQWWNWKKIWGRREMHIYCKSSSLYKNRWCVYTVRLKWIATLCSRYTTPPPL